MIRLPTGTQSAENHLLRVVHSSFRHKLVGDNRFVQFFRGFQLLRGNGSDIEIAREIDSISASVKYFSTSAEADSPIRTNLPQPWKSRRCSFILLFIQPDPD